MRLLFLQPIGINAGQLLNETMDYFLAAFRIRYLLIILLFNIIIISTSEICFTINQIKYIQYTLRIFAMKNNTWIFGHNTYIMRVVRDN